MRPWSLSEVRREALIVVVIFAAVTCLFFNEVVFFGRTVLPLASAGVMGLRGPYGDDDQFRVDRYRVDPGASTWYSEPAVRKVGQELREGRWPLWNDDQGFGSPLLAAGQPGALNPLRLPIYISASAFAWDFYYLARTFFGLVAVYLFARFLGLTTIACYFLAIAYGFSGHFLIFSNNMWVESYFLLPVILLGTDMILRGYTRTGIVLVAVTVGLCLLVGMPEVALCVLLYSSGYGAYRLIEFALMQRLGWPFVKRLCLLILGWLVGIALAAPLLFTLFEYVVQSSKLADRRETLGLGHAPLSDFVIWLVPYLNGLPLDPGNANSINTYVGVIVGVLALYGLYPSRDPVYRRIVPFAAISATVLIAKGLGTPVINEIGRLPGLNVTQIQKWSAPLAGFSLALLASTGLHYLTLRKIRQQWSTVAMIVVSGLILVGLWMKWSVSITTSPRRVWIPVAVGLVFAVSWWAVIHILRPVRPSLLRGLACCGLLVAELFAYAPHNIYQDRHDRFTEPPYVAFLQGQQERAQFRVFASDALLFPNSASVYGLDDIRSLDALYIDRYLLYIQDFVSPLVHDRFVGGRWASAEADPTLVLNPWFDLTGARYVVTTQGSPTAAKFRGGIVEAVFAAESARNVKHQDVHVEPLTINGVTKQTLFEHPPDTIRYPARIRSDSAILRFSVAMRPEVWNAKGDGVGFEIAVEVNGTSETVYRRSIDPKLNQDERRWLDDSVDLSRFAGQNVTLLFKTDPLSSPDADWTGWGDLRFTSASDEPVSQYVKVYDSEVQIYENRDVMPRAFLVQKILAAGDLNEAIAAMKGGNVDPRVTAIVEGVPPSAIAGLGIQGGTANLIHYDATQATISVDTKDSAYLVFTDSSYPGWKATIDGQETPIYTTNVAFRGVVVPAGRHTVRFVYQPASFSLGLVVAGVGILILLITLLSGSLARRRPWRTDTQVDNDVAGTVLPEREDPL